MWVSRPGLGLETDQDHFFEVLVLVLVSASLVSVSACLVLVSALVSEDLSKTCSYVQPQCYLCQKSKLASECAQLFTYLLDFTHLADLTGLWCLTDRFRCFCALLHLLHCNIQMSMNENCLCVLVVTKTANVSVSGVGLGLGLGLPGLDNISVWMMVPCEYACNSVHCGLYTKACSHLAATGPLVDINICKPSKLCHFLLTYGQQASGCCNGKPKEWNSKVGILKAKAKTSIFQPQSQAKV